MVNIGVIGGTGFASNGAEKVCPTDYGVMRYREFDVGGKQVIVAARHNDLEVPHLIDYRKLAQGMKLLGCKVVVGISASGRLAPEVLPGNLVIPSDFVNLDGYRSFSDDGYMLQHCSMNPAFSEPLRQVLKTAGWAVHSQVEELYRKASPTVDLHFITHASGTYVNIRGPDFATPAEEYMIRYTKDAKVIGMTIGKEAHPMRQMGIAYAAIAQCTDHSNFPGAPKVTHADGVKVIAPMTSQAARILLEEAVTYIDDNFNDEDSWNALRNSIDPADLNLCALRQSRPNLVSILEKELYRKH